MLRLVLRLVMDPTWMTNEQAWQWEKDGATLETTPALTSRRWRVDEHKHDIHHIRPRRPGAQQGVGAVERVVAVEAS